MKLPKEFLQRIQARRGNTPAFLRAYEQKPYHAIRVNPLKISVEEFAKISPFALSPVPWEKNGFYIQEEKAGADVYHFAGLYYCQEPSAMSAVPELEVRRGERVLDLCAAPGGKSGQIGAYLQGEGILYSNEYVTSRTKPLAENLERLGVKNAVLLNEDSAKLSKEFTEYFDKILVDAPCSGEGMFRKDEVALQEWSAENVRRCALRQAEILENAVKMLAGGGRLVYSTCTFSEEENEWQIEEFLKKHPEMQLLSQKKLLPHEVAGEGHFVAVLQKNEGNRGQKRAFPAVRDKKAEQAYRAFAKDFFLSPEEFDGEITTLSDGRMFLLPKGMEACSLRLLRAGVELGEWDGKLFKPSHSLVSCMKGADAQKKVRLSREECEKYLRGETVEYSVENGWVTVCVEEYPLGLGKAVNGVIKNHYPKGLRRVKR